MGGKVLNISLTQDDSKEQHRSASPLNMLLPEKHRVRNIKDMSIK